MFPDNEVVQSQWFTPQWAAQEIVDRYFSDLRSTDLVLEPSCGLGSFLQAIPEDVPAIGIEIDPEIAAHAKLNTGREIILGDFRHCDMPDGVTAMIGNPPFQVNSIVKLVNRAAALSDCKRAGFILPAYSLQTHNTVYPWLNHWSMKVDLMPRNIFPRSRLPLVFCLFTRDGKRNMIGMAFYREACEYDRLGDRAKELLKDGRPRKGVWRALVDDCLSALGGEANLQDIYHMVEPRRPTPNAFWKEKVRQILQLHFEPVQPGRWRTIER